MKIRAAIATVCLLLIGTCSHSYAQYGRKPSQAADTSNVSITVRTSQETPAADARIEIHDMNGSSIASGYTNTGGIFEVTGRFPAGTYEVVATHGLSEARERMNLSGGGFASIALRLPTNNDQGNIGGSTIVSVAQYKVPDKARKLFRKAQESLDKSKLDEAKENLRKALEIYPHYAEALCLRGVLKIDTRDHEGAVADLDEAIQVDPSYAMSYFALGAVYNLTSKFDDALRTLDRGVSLAPTAWQGYFEMAKAHIGKADYAAALKQLDKAQALNRQNYPLISLLKGHALLALKQYPEAMTELEAFLQKAPADPQSEAARKMLGRAKAFAATTQP
jgi:tetratricopeptide (TPR) repeat protein